MDIREFKEAIEVATGAALRFKDAEDGGTCNLDSPVIMLPDGIKARDTRDLKDAYGRPLIEKVGGGIWKGWYFVNVPLYGQANRRTKMAEAASKSLEESGIRSSMYYQMD